MGSVRGKATGKFVVFQAIQQEVAKLFCFSAWKKNPCLFDLYLRKHELRNYGYCTLISFTRHLRWFSVVFSEIWKPER